MGDNYDAKKVVVGAVSEISHFSWRVPSGSVRNFDGNTEALAVWNALGLSRNDAILDCDSDTGPDRPPAGGRLRLDRPPAGGRLRRRAGVYG
jgi:hypothetical protein